MNTLLDAIEVPYYAIVDFALGAPRAATVVAVLAAGLAFVWIAA